MSHTFRRTIRLKITLIAVSFSLALALLLSTFSFAFFSEQARRSVIQAAEFNLQLVGGTIGQELASLDMLAKWCTTTAQVSHWLTHESLDPQLSIDLYNRLREELMNNKANVYLRRILLTDVRGTRIVHTGSSPSDSWPVTIYNIVDLGLARLKAASVFETCIDDPYAIGKMKPVLMDIRPILANGTTEIAGHVMLAVSSDIILDRLVNYRMVPGSSLYLTLPGATYRIDGREFVDVTGRLEVSSDRNESTLGKQTLVRDVRVDGGRSMLMVTCPVGFDGIAVSQVFSGEKIPGEWALFLDVLVLIMAAALTFALFISALLNRVITQPLSAIKKRIAGIAESDLSVDRSIEWDNELGDIGRGINDMSGKIASLLETSLADEKRKRDLEYRMLQSQINPHFLYNTLNSIKWMATLQNAAGIAEMTTALSRLMKNAIKGARTEVPLRDEISLLDDYFLIQQYRYGGSIKFLKTVPDELLSVAIPCFVLQPIMENAIFHGIEPKGGTGTIALRVSVNGEGNVEIVIEDDGIGMSAEKIAEVLVDGEHVETTGFFREIGVSSVDRRIRHSFGDAFGLTLASEQGSYTRATVVVPRVDVSASREVAS